MDLYQQVIHKSRYARYIPELGRRENWEESVDRYINYLYKQAKKNVTNKDKLHEIYLILGATCEE